MEAILSITSLYKVFDSHRTKVGISRTAAMDFQKSVFGLFRSLVERLSSEAVPKGKSFQEGWTFSNKENLKVQEQTIPM